MTRKIGELLHLPSLSSELCNYCRSHINNQIGKEILEKSRKRKQNRPQKFQTPLLPHTPRSLLSSYNQESLSPTKKIRKVEEKELQEERNAREVLFLFGYRNNDCRPILTQTYS